MRKAIWIVFALALVALNIFLLMGITHSPSWSETALGIVPAALVTFLCFVLLLAGAWAKASPRFLAPVLWAVALLWCLVMGGITTVDSSQKYESHMEPVTTTKQVGPKDRYGLRQTRTSIEPRDEARARDDFIGKVFGWILLGFAGVAFVGMAVSLVLNTLRLKSSTALPMQGNMGHSQPSLS